MSITVKDIAWAAGVYEGEGNCNKHQITIAQKETWLLYKLQDLFGGSIGIHKTTKISYLSMSGINARQFALCIFTFLSPHKRKQIRDSIIFIRTCHKGHLMTGDNIQNKVRCKICYRKRRESYKNVKSSGI